MSNFIESEGKFSDNINLRFVYGHTKGMMLPQIKYGDKTLIYMADLIPASYHVPIPWVMGYDMHPLTTMEEKEIFLSEAAKEEHIFFFEHDPVTECCTVEKTERGYKVKEKIKISEL